LTPDRPDSEIIAGSRADPAAAPPPAMIRQHGRSSVHITEDRPAWRIMVWAEARRGALGTQSGSRALLR